MKSYVYAAIATLALAAPVASYSQSTNAPVTRAQVKAELAELEQAGYDPLDMNDYPENIQAAEQRVAAKHAAQGDNVGSGVRKN